MSSIINNGLWTTNTSIDNLNINNNGLSTTNTSIGNLTASKTTKYHVLGEEIEVDGYKDNILTIILCNITIMGEPYYNELIKNGFDFTKDLEDLFKRKFRENKIDQILED
jgi:hypothetical protein